MGRGKQHFLYKTQSDIKKKRFNKRFLSFENKKKINKRIILWLDEINLLFSYILKSKASQFIKYAPYKVRVQELVAKNQWTTGTFCAINQNDGTLDLHLNYKALLVHEKIPIEKMAWVFFHEFRHKIQLHDENIRSVLDFPNWNNFNVFMQKRFKKNEDFINHIFHELNPAEVDANIFACEMTSVKFGANPFSINDQTLSLLTKREPKKQPVSADKK